MKKILICEDEPTLATLMKLYLSKKYSVSHANNGVEAIDLLKKKDYDLILIDVNMPIINGLEVVKILRDCLKKETPVVITSACSEVYIMDELKGYEVFECFLKPFSYVSLVKKIDVILNSNDEGRICE